MIRLMVSEPTRDITLLNLRIINEQIEIIKKKT